MRRRTRALVVVLVVISLASTITYLREGAAGPLHSLQSGFSALVAPAKSASGALSATEDGFSQAIENASASESTLSALREQNEQLRQTIAQLEEYRQEAERLQGLLDLKNLYAAETVTARVLSRTSDPWNIVLTIDKGTTAGVRAGLPVMGPTGLVGQVIATTPATSEVRLLQDPQSGVAVVIQSSREEGIVRGNLDGLLYLEDVDDEVEVRPGDVVITSGLGGGYFSGIMVGTISKVDGEPGTASRKIIIDANAQAKPFEEVMVVTSMRSGNAEGTNGATTADGTDQSNQSAGDASYVDDASYTGGENSYSVDESYGYSEEGNEDA